MKKFALILMLIVLALNGQARAQSTIDGLPTVPTFPLPDPSITPEALWMTQNGGDFKIPPTKLGYIFQGTCTNLQLPYTNQLCWDTSTTPAQMKVYQGGVWAIFPNVTGLATLNSPAFTGVPTAPTAPPGTNTTQLATTAFVNASQPTRLTGPLTMYVNPFTGSDSNTCTVQTAPCQTVQHPFDVLRDNYDLAGQTVTVQLADGTYTPGLNLAGLLTGQGSTENLILQGNVSAPDNVVIIDSRGAPDGVPVLVTAGAQLTLQGVHLISGYRDLFADRGSTVDIQNIDFGAAADSHIAVDSGSLLRIDGSYTISGGAAQHFNAVDSGVIKAPGISTVTLTGTPNFSFAFVRAVNGGEVVVGSPTVTFSGTSATGLRYNASGLAIIDTKGSGINYFPGSLPGLLASGSQYDNIVSQRILFTQNMTFYVSPSGSDTNNNCLVQASPCQTPQAAWNVLQRGYDMSGFTATIQLADGTYTSGILAFGQILGQTGPSSVTIQGNMSTPDNVFINSAGANAFQADTDSAFTVQGMKITTPNSCLVAGRLGYMQFGNIDFAGCTGAAVSSAAVGIIADNGMPITISGGGAAFIETNNSGKAFLLNTTVTISGNPTFTMFVDSSSLGFVNATGLTFVGTGTVGQKFFVSNNSYVTTGAIAPASNINYFPGTLPGTIMNGGQYDNLASTRARFTQNMTFYVAPTGVDGTNTCLVQASPCLTPQYAFNQVQNNYDMNGFTGTIQLADGSYSSGVIAFGQVPGQMGSAGLIIQGNVVSPDNVVVNGTVVGGSGGTTFDFDAEAGSTFQVQGMKLTNAGNCLIAGRFGYLTFSSVDFGGCAGSAIASSVGGVVAALGNFTVSGGGAYMANTGNSGRILIGSNVITIANTPNFSGAFVRASNLGFLNANADTFPGTAATGQRFDIENNSIIVTGAGSGVNGCASSTFFPGSIGGLCANGGILN